MPTVSAPALAAYGLHLTEPSALKGRLTFERPAHICGHRLKDCTIGAFTFFNGAGNTSVYRTELGRYSQVGESSIIGPPEHPMDWFSNHPFAFTRPEHMPSMYALEDFARLSPDSDNTIPAWATAAKKTVLGHESYIGAGSFVKRGVTIGDGAVVGARSVVTRDIPPFAIAVGSPARVVRLRFTDNIVERMLALQWWRYDLAPFKKQVDFAKVEATLAFFEERNADGQLDVLQPTTYELETSPEGYRIAPIEGPLYR